MSQMRINSVVMPLVSALLISTFCLPASIRAQYSLTLFGVEMFAGEFVLYSMSVCFMIFLVRNKVFSIATCFLLGALSILPGNMLGHPGEVLKFYVIGSGFYFSAMLVFSLRTRLSDLSVQLSVFIIMLFLSIQCLIVSLGIANLSDNRTIYSYGKLIRPITTAGPSTLTSCVILTAAAYLNKSFSNNRKRLFLVNLVAIGGISFSMARGALIAYLMASIVFMFLNSKRASHILLYCLISCAAFGVAQHIGFIDSLSNRSEEVKDDYSSGRFERWEQAFSQLNASSAVFGLGSGTTPYDLAMTNNPDGILASPHNTFLSFLFESGVLSAVLYLGIILGMLYSNVRNHGLDFGTLLLLFTFVVTMNVELIFRNFNVSALLWLAMLSKGK